MKAAGYMVALQLANDPLVRQCVRQTYYERAKISVRPTKKGIKVGCKQKYILVPIITQILKMSRKL